MTEKTSNPKEMKMLLYKQWPVLTGRNRIIFFDKEFELPSLNVVRQLVASSTVDRIKQIPNIMECEDFALLLHADIKRLRLPHARFSLAFGRAVGNQFRGLPGMHQVNIVITDTKEIFLIEPQTDEIWPADSQIDDVFFVEF